jgi:hypothetical protein
MTPAETFILVRAVQGACPQQKIDEYTPDMWHQLLDDIDFKDAQAAVVAVVKRKDFVSPADIRGEVRRIRTERVSREWDFVPDADPDNPREFIAALRAGVARIADGSERPRPVQQLIAGTAKGIPA